MIHWALGRNLFSILYSLILTLISDEKKLYHLSRLEAPC